MACYSYSIGFIVLVVASIFVVAQDGPTSSDPCVLLSTNCTTCVLTTFTNAKNVTRTCSYLETRNGPVCSQNRSFNEGVTGFATTPKDCDELAHPGEPGETTTTPPSNTTTTPAPSTTTTQPPTTTNATTTTQAPTTTNATTTPTPAPTPTTNGTTTAAPTTSSTTPAPSNVTSTAAPPTPTPAPSHSGGWSSWSFFGGIVFALALSALGYIIWRFYKARLDRNYHTFNNPTF